MGGHGGHVKPTKYFSIHDIPDEMVQTYSKRDPDNKFYQTRRWVNFKKKQILYTQQDGVPSYLRTLPKRVLYYSLWASTFGLFALNIYRFNYHTNKK